MIFLLPPVVGCDTGYHLLDQGKVGYLYHLQILLFNLQDALSSDNVSSSLSTLLLMCQYNNNNNDRDNTVDGTTVESYAQTYHIVTITMRKLLHMLWLLLLS